MSVHQRRDVQIHQHSAQGPSVWGVVGFGLVFCHSARHTRHLHIPHCHSNSGFSLPRLSARDTAMKMLNNVDLLCESVNGADTV